MKMENMRQSDIESLVDVLERRNAVGVTVSEDRSSVEGSFGPEKEIDVEFVVEKGRPWFNVSAKSEKLNLRASGFNLPLPKMLLPATIRSVDSILDGFEGLYSSVRRIRRGSK